MEIPPRSLLCPLNEVSVIDSWTPDLSQKQETKSSTSKDLDVQIDEDNLTSDQFLEQNLFLTNGQTYFPRALLTSERQIW